MKSPELLERAELLKWMVVDEKGKVAWPIRLELQRVLEDALLDDVDYAVSNQAEQLLWNWSYKNCIDACKTVNSAHLQLFLDAARGYLSHFLSRLCRQYQLTLDCYPSDATLGILNGRFGRKKKAANSSLLYLAQFCLVHSGDIARYQKDVDGAETFYIHAWLTSPNSGHPLNQLAILETMAGRRLSALSLYVRSLYVTNPFPLAAINIDKFYDTVDVDDTALSLFFGVLARARKRGDLEEAEGWFGRLGPALVDSFGRGQLDEGDAEDMMVIVVGEMWKEISGTEHGSLALLVRLLIALLIVLLRLTDPRYSAPIKLATDFLTIHPDIISGHRAALVDFYGALADALNGLQSPQVLAFGTGGPTRPALPEDRRLRGFLPLEKIHARLDFDQENRPDEGLCGILRAQRILEFGKRRVEWVNEAELFNAVSSGTTAHQRWEFTAEKTAPTEGAVSAVSKGTKRQTKTKVVPLITIMERNQSRSGNEGASIRQDRADGPARFQAARLKQALSGDVPTLVRPAPATNPIGPPQHQSPWSTAWDQQRTEPTVDQDSAQSSQQQEPQFSLFGTDAPWEYKPERIGDQWPI